MASLYILLGCTFVWQREGYSYAFLFIKVAEIGPGLMLFTTAQQSVFTFSLQKTWINCKKRGSETYKCFTVQDNYSVVLFKALEMFIQPNKEMIKCSQSFTC